MTAVEAAPVPLPSDEPTAQAPGPDALPSLCPYLATTDGNWRSASASREHRCMAVFPPVPLAQEKQRRLCLVASHVDCATYGAALATYSRPTERVLGHSRPIARMTPVILDEGRFDLRIPALRADRRSGQAVLVGLLGVAFVAILLARPSGNAGTAGRLVAGASAAAAGAGASADAAIVAPTLAAIDATSAPAATASPSDAAAPSREPNAPSPGPGPSSGASAPPANSGATYRVKNGDTLSAIAARYGTTVRVLIKLNGIVDPSRLKIGQVLRLP